MCKGAIEYFLPFLYLEKVFRFSRNKDINCYRVLVSRFLCRGGRGSSRINDHEFPFSNNIELYKRPLKGEGKISVHSFGGGPKRSSRLS